MQTTPQLNDRDHSIRRSVPSQQELRSNVELVHHILGGRDVALGHLPDHIYWAVVGLLLGYPLCCVQDFIARITGKRPVQHEPRPLRGTGFVPCAECAAAFASDPEQLVAIINVQRHECIQPFTSQIDKPELPIGQLKAAYEKVRKKKS